MDLSTVDSLFDRMAQRGQGMYGLSDVNQLDHGLQSAALAQERGLGEAMTIAALFHDIGHLRTASDVALAERGIDDRHETSSARILERLFEPAVSDPVRLHVLAKRYLCTVEKDYFDRLGGDSRLSLTLQGETLSAVEIAEFEAEPFFEEAVALRRVDDDAKIPGLDVPGLDNYRDMALALSRRHAA